MIGLHFVLTLTYCFSGLFVFLSVNPMHSILFLILTFCCAACILFLFTADFLGLVFIIIYVGAIAILFLFVVMMINVKKVLAEHNYSLIFFFSILFFSQILLFLTNIFDFGEIKNFQFQNGIDSLSSIDSLGQYLYNNLLVCFLLAGILLLVAMLGAIVLTLNFNSSRKNQLISRQLSRSIECVHSFNF